MLLLHQPPLTELVQPFLSFHSLTCDHNGIVRKRSPLLFVELGQVKEIVLLAADEGAQLVGEELVVAGRAQLDAEAMFAVPAVGEHLVPLRAAAVA